MTTIRHLAGHAQYQGKQPGATATAIADVTTPATPRIDWEALRTAGRACCCAARPVVVALIPPAPGRAHRTDLLLCMHHFRVSRQALSAVRACICDLRGTSIGPQAPGFLTEP